MPFQAAVYRVLIASPSDLDRDRKSIAAAIHDWNSKNAAEQQVMLLPVMWETDAIPETGGRPQGFINDRLVRSADIIIGAFWTRVGNSSGAEESGTIEEIKEGLKVGKKVMLYFSKKPWPQQRINRDQHQKLEEFKNWCRNNAIYFEFDSGSRLREAIGKHLTGTIRDLHQTHVPSQREDGARELRRIET